MAAYLMTSKNVIIYKYLYCEQIAKINECVEDISYAQTRKILDNFWLRSITTQEGFEIDNFVMLMNERIKRH